MQQQNFMSLITKFIEMHTEYLHQMNSFNHESPLRGETFVTKKITKALTRIKLNKQKNFYLETFIQNEIGDMPKLCLCNVENFEF